MQLQTARLCLDCEEVHDAQQCPICASESFAAITRWVPTTARRGRSRPNIAPEAAVYRAIAEGKAPSSTTRQLLKHGALGLTAVSLIGWFLRRSSKPLPKAGATPDPIENPTSGRADAALATPGTGPPAHR